MGMQLHMHSQLTIPLSQDGTLISYSALCFFNQRLQQNRAFGLAKNVTKDLRSRRRDVGVVVASSPSNIGLWENWKPEKGAKSPSLSDVVWPSAGAFAAMAVLATKGLSITIAPLGAVCAVLFATPSSPGARQLESWHFQYLVPAGLLGAPA